MSEFEISTSTYRSCTLPQYGSRGRTVPPHMIVSKYIRPCTNPRPANGSAGNVCEERYQVELMNVTNPEDRDHTKATGECPACMASAEKCLEVHIVLNPNVTRDSVALEPTIAQPVVARSAEQDRVAELGRTAAEAANTTIEPKKKSRPRASASASRAQPSHGKQNNKRDCCIIQ